MTKKLFCLTSSLGVINNAKNKIVKTHKGEKIDIYIEEGESQTKIVITDNGGKIPEKIRN